jgi:HAD superfamily hydrolase (TIGR01549 family)
MRPYELLLLDLDDTVVEFTRARRDCFVRAAWQLHPAADGHALYETFCLESDRLWAGHREGRVTLAEVREKRFATVLKDLPLDPKQFTEIFYEILSCAEGIMPGAPEAVRDLQKKFRLVGISNGRKEVQAERLRRLGLESSFEFLLGPEDCGFAKPHPALFLMSLEKAGVTKDQALVVGDGLGTDIEGAQRTGLDSFWLNLEARELGEGEPRPTFQGAGLHDLVKLLF